MDIKDIIKPENKVYGKSPVLTDNIMHYCPGCSHGTVHKLIAEVIDEMGIQDKTIGISPLQQHTIKKVFLKYGIETKPVFDSYFPVYQW